MSISSKTTKHSYIPTKPWTCGLCEKRDNPPEAFECTVCMRDRTLEYRWDYNFYGYMYIKSYQPFKVPKRVAMVQLPEGWEEYYDEEGYVYFYHAESEHYQYERPTAAAIEEAEPQKALAQPGSPRLDNDAMTKPPSPRKPGSPRVPNSPRY